MDLILKLFTLETELLNLGFGLVKLILLPFILLLEDLFLLLGNLILTLKFFFFFLVLGHDLGVLLSELLNDRLHL